MYGLTIRKKKCWIEELYSRYKSIKIFLCDVQKPRHLEDSRNIKRALTDYRNTNIYILEKNEDWSISQRNGFYFTISSHPRCLRNHFDSFHEKNIMAHFLKMIQNPFNQIRSILRPCRKLPVRTFSIVLTAGSRDAAAEPKVKKIRSPWNEKKTWLAFQF